MAMSKGTGLLSKSGYPEDASKLLNDALFADSAASVAGGTIMSAIAAFCWMLTGAAAPLALFVFGSAITFLRREIAMRRRFARRPWMDLAFAASTLIYVFSSGVLTFWAYVFTNDPVILTVTLVVSIVNTISIALRSFAVENFVKLQIIAITVPVTAAFAIRGGPFYVAAGMELVLGWHVYKSAARVRSILLSEISFRRRSETVATRFRFAIDNMSHGMCMVDSDMRIVISNAEMSECLGLPAARSLQGTKFAAIMRLARRRGKLDSADIDRLMASFDSTLAPESVARVEAPGAWGRIYDMTLKRHDEGGWVLVVQDITEQRRAHQALDAAARFDPMTGLPNRRSFETQLTQALAAAAGTPLRTEVLFVALDGFKQLNDTLGHKFGDHALVEAAHRLREAVEGAYLARWGGDEFVILRAGTDNEATLRYAQRLIHELSRPMWIDGSEASVGASGGVAACVGGGVSMDALLQQADMALFAAKRENRGGCRLYESSMSERAHQRRLLELDLQAAFAAGTFELHYQPIVDLETGELVSFEALARWRHPTRGAVPPALFVPSLEDLNLMNAFGAWSLQRACEDAARWPLPVRVCVNVSTKQIATLPESVRRALAVSGLSPDRLELEITETAALAAGGKASRTLEAVRALGVKVALDDFGTGYSSLSHLMQLPLDKVKIDKSFTQELGRSRKADVLVASIARISSQLGLRVTFEGIETAEQLDRARAYGVPAEGQGWLFGKAMPAKELDRFFAAETRRAVA